ncbi:MAG TPA: sugar ABC transporter permease [Chloroflexota bacterium]|nr:sugar ABC transporter permease [Chloroflexota bacterium]
MKRPRPARGRRIRNQVWGLFFTAPWIIGLLCFHAYPIVASFGYGFTEYTLLKPPKWNGLENYGFMFADPHYWRAVGNTLWFVAVAVPINIAFSFFVAVLLNQRVVLRSALRTVCYLPTIVPQAAAALLWLWVFNPFGLINGALALLGIPAVSWLGDPAWTKPALTIVSLWIAGSNIVLFLAALQDVPQHLREAARIDGAGWWSELLHVVVPFVTPALLFTTIAGMIWAFQYFTFAWIMTGTGPAESTLFYAMYIYQNAFSGFRMGLASAMAWLMFLLVAACTLVVFRSSTRWVYYGGD